MRYKSWTILLFFGVVCSAMAQQTTFFLSGNAQGTTYQVQYVAENAMVIKVSVDSIIDQIDQSMSLYQPHSLICMFNRELQYHRAVDTHMEKVIRKAIEVHQQSGGLFDITVKPLVDLWGFGSERIKQFPQKEAVDSVLSFVGMENIWLEDNRLHKRDLRIAIDLNGIAQGYTVDVLAQFLEVSGIENYLVELGGEIRTKGTKVGGADYEIAIERPNGEQSSSFVLNVPGRAVTTSGNYRKQAYYQDRKIHHHINPKTGYPIQNSVVSATVIAPTAMEADAYDNVFMALSPSEGKALANRLPGIEVYLIYEESGVFKEAFSDGFRDFVKH
ncbi:FAD:protein FMN transferase [Sphingobacterium sp. lm-10]|uniref:FAD:protein FMN transferase n=1 Tax=Sphingobacterium sp. lm-10 TaxID=2944904 RepID=UPI0020209AB6|nr:FAD:protein FMN transferase [Sphingobacterium sp. lm-10]MCL7987515.1 FAD:protein FMN transferase [Sphingobacterium sp. lm-10]